MTYHVLLLVKFIGVTTFAGGMVASFVSSNAEERKRAVHRIASPGLLLTWVGGAGVAELLATPLTELWILGGLGFSFLSQSALVIAVSREKRSAFTVLSAVVPLLVVLLFMVFRPTWASVRS